jgi:hypothetical protein
VYASPHLTPAQLLDSGRRAETEGKLDLALHFYRHVNEHHAHTPEAAEARNGLGRVGAAQSQVWHQNGAAYANGSTLADGGHRARPPRAHRRRPMPPRDHYRAGRALARVFSALGWLTVAASIAAPMLYVVAGAAGLPRVGVLALAGLAASATVAGMLVVFACQVARAVFDQANATRELAVLERAKLYD